MDKANAKRYFISRNGQQAGPYTKEQLLPLNILAETRVWNEDAFDWMKAETFEELKEVVSASRQIVHHGPRHWWQIGRDRQP